MALIQTKIQLAIKEVFAFVRGFIEIVRFFLHEIWYNTSFFLEFLEENPAIFQGQSESEESFITKPEQPSFGRQTGKTAKCIVFYYGVKGQVTLDEARYQFSEFVKSTCIPVTSESLLQPGFTRYPETWCNVQFWMRDSYFDIKNHVKDCKEFLDNNNNKQTSGMALDVRSFSEQLLEKDFEDRRSPWEVIVVNHYGESVIAQPHPITDSGSTIYLFRIHPDLADRVPQKCFS